MTDSLDRISFRHGWLPVSRSLEVVLNLLSYADDFSLPAKPYYFKPIEGFEISGMSDDDKFECIDSYIVQEFGCDPDDIITLSSDRFRGFIVVPGDVLIRAGIKLPRWPEIPRHIRTPRAGLALVAS